MSELNPSDIEKMKADFAAKGGKASQIPAGATCMDPSTVPEEFQFFRRGMRGAETIWPDEKRARIRALIAAEASRETILAAMDRGEFTKWHNTVNQLRNNGIQLPKYLEMDMDPDAARPRTPRSKKKGQRFRVLSRRETEAFDFIRGGLTVTQALRSAGLPFDNKSVRNIGSLIVNRFGSQGGLIAISSRGKLLDMLDEYASCIPKVSARVCIRCKGVHQTMDDRAEAKRCCEYCETVMAGLARGSFV